MSLIPTTGFDQVAQWCRSQGATGYGSDLRRQDRKGPTTRWALPVAGPTHALSFRRSASVC